MGWKFEVLDAPITGVVTITGAEKDALSGKMRWIDSPSQWHGSHEVAEAVYLANHRAPGDLLRRGILYKGKIADMRAALRLLNLANSKFWEKE